MSLIVFCTCCWENSFIKEIELKIQLVSVPFAFSFLFFSVSKFVRVQKLDFCGKKITKIIIVCIKNTSIIKSRKSELCESSTSSYQHFRQLWCSLPDTNLQVISQNVQIHQVFPAVNCSIISSSSENVKFVSQIINRYSKACMNVQQLQKPSRTKHEPVGLMNRVVIIWYTFCPKPSEISNHFSSWHGKQKHSNKTNFGKSLFLIH